MFAKVLTNFLLHLAAAEAAAFRGNGVDRLGKVRAWESNGWNSQRASSCIEVGFGRHLANMNNRRRRTYKVCMYVEHTVACLTWPQQDVRVKLGVLIVMRR